MAVLRARFTTLVAAMSIREIQVGQTRVVQAGKETSLSEDSGKKFRKIRHGEDSLPHRVEWICRPSLVRADRMSNLMQ